MAQDSETIPRIFISSTDADLKGYREVAKNAALGADCKPELHDFWPAQDNPPLDECLAQVARCKALVVLVAHRYGWVPEDAERNPDGKSITRLECERAVKLGIPVFAFLLDDQVKDWPEERKEEYRLNKAMREGNATPALFAEVQERIIRLTAFKSWLEKRAIRKTFTNREDLAGKVVDRAERFLREEEIDSGILVARGHDLRYWHLSFQEYLAARALGGRNDQDCRAILLAHDGRLYANEWREPVLLLGGVLYTQGRAKVDGLVQAILEALYRDGEPDLPAQARSAGLLGAMVRDLAPYDYRPADPRYGRLMEAALGVLGGAGGVRCRAGQVHPGGAAHPGRRGPGPGRGPAAGG